MLKSSSRSRAKHKAIPYKDRRVPEDVIGEFLEEHGVAQWMHDLADLIKKVLESDVVDDPALPVANPWI